ncbi:MAG: hypothetical protein H8E12_07955 [Rhodobacteraceae bacterium]|nr:hypothetical protein [Paracoccaceae bacterium]
MPETVIGITTGSLVKQNEAGPATERKKVSHPGEIGIVITLYETKGHMAIWSPLTAKILWPDGSIEIDVAVASLQVI